jgi:hypothetical protein
MPQTTTKESSALLELLSRPIAFHRVFVKIGGNVAAGLMLSQAFYWSKNRRAVERDGWFYKSHADWEEETGLTRREQQTARAHLRKKKLLEERDGSLKGKGRVLWFRVNRDALFEALKGFVNTETRAAPSGGNSPADVEGGGQGVAPNRPTPMGGNARPVAQKRPTSLITSETTAENNAQNTHTRLRAAGAPEERVCVSGSLARKAYERYARNHPAEIHNPPGWVTKALRTGEWDDQVEVWCIKQGIDPHTGEPVIAADSESAAASSVADRVDTSACPDCHGTGMWYPEGFDKGVAKCRHPRLPKKAA